MLTEKVAKELRSAVDMMVKERDELDDKISMMEGVLAKLGGEKRGPGRPKGSKNKAAAKAAAKVATPGKRGPGRPKGSKNKTKKATAAKSTASKAGKPKNWSSSARKEASERMKRYWAERRKAKG